MRFIQILAITTMASIHAQAAPINIDANVDVRSAESLPKGNLKARTIGDIGDTTKAVLDDNRSTAVFIEDAAKLVNPAKGKEVVPELKDALDSVSSGMNSVRAREVGDIGDLTKAVLDDNRSTATFTEDAAKLVNPAKGEEVVPKLKSALDSVSSGSNSVRGGQGVGVDDIGDTTKAVLDDNRSTATIIEDAAKFVNPAKGKEVVPHLKDALDSVSSGASN